jgi:hypothetical protein
MQQVELAVRNNKQVRLIAYSVSPSIEERLKRVLFIFLEHYQCEVLHDTLYTAIKELLINATKANYKNIFFENYRTKNQAEQIIDYETSLKLFRLEMSREGAQYLTRLSRLRDLKADVLFRVRNGTLMIDVANPAPMTRIEIENVTKKLDFARQCVDISEYFETQFDDPNQEGAGLGLILITMILKSLGQTERGFRISSNDKETVASMEVPLSKETLSYYFKNTGKPAG